MKSDDKKDKSKGSIATQGYRYLGIAIQENPNKEKKKTLVSSAFKYK